MDLVIFVQYPGQRFVGLRSFKANAKIACQILDNHGGQYCWFPRLALALFPSNAVDLGGESGWYRVLGWPGGL